MDDRIASVEIRFQAFSSSEEGGPERSMRVLRHIDRYDPPEEYPNRVSNLGDLDVDNLERANYAVADHVPDELSALDDEPNVFTAGYEEFLQAADAQFLADYDRREDFYDAVGHVLEATPLRINRLGVAYDLQADISAGREVGEIPTPETFLTEYRVSPEENRSEVSMGLDKSRVETTFEEVAVLEELVEESLAFTTDRLLPEL